MTTDANPRMFAQITKVDAAKRLVYGRMTEQKRDKSGETLHYEKSKPYFKEWSDAFMAATDGKSFGNVRALHNKVAAGKLAQPIIFNDAQKAMDICAKVTDDNEWPKCLDGTYTGFSIGGGYVERWVEKSDAGAEDAWYVAKPAEVSLVDNPCLDSAKFFEVVKADGVVEKVAFKVEAVPPPVIEVTGTDEEVAEFAKVLNESKLTMADAIALLKKAGETPEPEHDLVKLAREIAGEKPEELAKSDKVQKIHDMITEMGGKCAAKAAPAGDVEKLNGEVAELRSQVAKWLAQPVPHVTLRAVQKGNESNEPKAPDLDAITIGSLTEAEKIMGADGTIDYAASLIHKREKALMAYKAASNP